MRNARWITPDEMIAAWENDDGTESSGLPPSGLPVASFDHEPLRSRLVEQVKGECRRRIERRYPAFRQLNLIREGDTAELGAWVAAHLDACDAHEATIAAADRAAVLAYDVTAGWPDAVGDAVRVRDDSAGDLSGNDESVRPVDLVEDEDPGEQPEIFTEEDVEALGAVAAEGESAASEPLLDTSDASLAASEAEPAAYPGIMTLPDELGARRNAVLAAIATEKLTRLKIATDPSRAAFLAERFAEYQNRGALSLEIDDMLLADYRAYLAMKDRQERITNYAMQLEQSALDGDMDRLEAMHVGLGEGWPT